MIEFVRDSNHYLRSTSAHSVSQPSGSISFWTRRTILGVSQQYVLYIDANFNIRFNFSNDLECTLIRGSSKNTESLFTFDSTTELYFIVCTYDDTGANTTNSIYVNGILNISESKQDAYVDNFQLTLGANLTGGDVLNAELEDVRMYDRVLSAAEIETMYCCQGHDGIIYGLLHRWLLNEGSDGQVVSGSESVIDYFGDVPLTPTNSPIYRPSYLSFRRRT